MRVRRLRLVSSSKGLGRGIESGVVFVNKIDRPNALSRGDAGCGAGVVFGAGCEGGAV